MTGLHGLRKNAPLFIVALITIALGVGVNTVMFSVANAGVLQPLPYPQPQRLASLWPEKRWSVGMLTDVRERVKSFGASRQRPTGGVSDVIKGSGFLNSFQET